MSSPLLKAVFSTANLNGAAAVLMSVGMGSAVATALYAGAVLAGTGFKYAALRRGSGRAVSGISAAAPTVTAGVFMLAAVWNFASAARDVFAGPEQGRAAGILRMAGWVCGFLGDNALRRLDGVNFREGGALGRAGQSRLRETFNALTANPTIFYNGASVAFTFAALRGREAAGLLSLENACGAAAAVLIAVGVAHAARKSWQAAQGAIAADGINDGVMNYLSSAAKALQAVATATAGNYWLAAAQSIFTASNVKLIYETRAALAKKPAPE